MATYLSSGAFKTSNLANLLEQASACGIERIELSSGVRHAPNLLETVKEHADRFDFLVHNYFPPPADPFVLNLGAVDEVTRNRSIEHCRHAIDLSHRLGAGFYSVHSGFAMRIKPEELGRPDAQRRAMTQSSPRYAEAYERFVSSVLELCQYADKKDMDFVIENNVLAPALVKPGHDRPLLMVEADEINRLFSDVDHRRLGLLVDTGHTKVSATALSFSPQEFVESVAPHIRAFHLSDNDGREDQNLTFDEDAWFAPFLSQFPDTTTVIEAYRLEPDEMFRQLEIVDALQLG